MARILLIEPDKILATTYSECLTQSGHKVIWKTSGQRAIEAADDQCPDLVIVELQLPGHNGLEFLYEFRSYTEWQEVPVIVLTHVPRREIEGSAAWPLLNTVFLYKPTTKLAKLLEAVNDATIAVSA